MNAWRHLFKLYNAKGEHLATLTAGNEKQARDAYAADNPAAQEVATAQQMGNGYPCEMFRIFA